MNSCIIIIDFVTTSIHLTLQNIKLVLLSLYFPCIISLFKDFSSSVMILLKITFAKWSTGCSIVSCTSATDQKRNWNREVLLLTGPGRGTQHTSKGHMGRSRQSKDRERKATPSEDALLGSWVIWGLQAKVELINSNRKSRVLTNPMGESWKAGETWSQGLLGRYTRKWHLLVTLQALI